MEDTAAEAAQKEAAKDSYEDCDPLLVGDQDCVEYWIFPETCIKGDYNCYYLMTTTACGAGNNLDCFVGFLRAMCASPIYYDVICDTPTFRNALKKDDNCLPGVNYCIGFQTMFGGPKDADSPCMPWDFYCALDDFYG